MNVQTKEVLLNDFAIRSFRDTADYDYIAARMAYRAKLIPQFLWSSLQAAEKYLKCLLLLNRIPAKKLRHDLKAGLDLLEKQAPFPLRLSESSRKLIEHLDTFGRFRYLETPFYVSGMELARLDKMIWEMRRYCTVLNYSVLLPDGTDKAMFQIELKRIEDSEKYPPQRFRLFRGTLEEILDDKTHPARAAIVWQNLYFGPRLRKRVRMPKFMHATNPPRSLHPDILDEVRQYVFLPREVVDAYRAELIKRSESGP